MGNCFKKE